LACILADERTVAIALVLPGDQLGRGRCTPGGRRVETLLAPRDLDRWREGGHEPGERDLQGLGIRSIDDLPHPVDGKAIPVDLRSGVARVKPSQHAIETTERMQVCNLPRPADPVTSAKNGAAAMARARQQQREDNGAA